MTFTGGCDIRHHSFPAERSDGTSNLPPSPAATRSHAERALLLNTAYADYPVPLHLTADVLAGLEQCYDVDLTGSVVARAGRQWAGMALLSRRGDRGWISGVGVLPAWRRRGIGRAMIAALLENAGERGVREIHLEVISGNVPARALYAASGFHGGRGCRRGVTPRTRIRCRSRRSSFRPRRWKRCWLNFDGWHDQPACWQGEAATLRNMAERMRGYRLLAGVPAGYCLVGERSDAVALLDVGLAPGAGMSAAGRTMLQALAARYRGRALTISNVPVDSGLNRVLAALHFLVTVRQVEMRRRN